MKSELTLVNIAVMPNFSRSRCGNLKTKAKEKKLLMKWNYQMFLQDAWEKRIKRNLVRQRMVVPTLFKGKFFLLLSVFSSLERLYARNGIGILKTLHLVKCPHGRCIHKNFQSQMMQIRNVEKQKRNLFTNSEKYIGIKYVRGGQ